MLIVGLIVGTVAGLLLADFVARYRSAGWLNWLATWGVVVLVLIFAASAGFFSTEVRVGLFFGISLGVLTGMTPLPLRTPNHTQ
jgi:hypothetical protein